MEPSQLHRARGALASTGKGAAPTLDRFLRNNLFLFFRARAFGETLAQGFGLNTGKWSLMRSVNEEGPQTVADIARARPVARQGVQRMADQLVRDGLIEYADNPAHRRAKLVRLTSQGEQTLRRLDAAFGPLIGAIAANFTEAELKTASGAVRKLSEIFEALLKDPALRARLTKKSIRNRNRRTPGKNRSNPDFDTAPIARAIEDSILARLRTR